MKKLRLLTFFFFLIVLTVFVNSQDLISIDDKEEPKGIVIDSNVFSIEWNIKKTGAEENLDISYNNINQTTTEFCIKPNDKTAYESALSLSAKDITNIPITKTDNVNVFSLEKESFDLSKTDEKTKEPIEQCFKIHYTSSFNNLSFKIGWETIEVDGSTSSSTISPPTTESIAYNSTGGIHLVYIESDSDLWYCHASEPWEVFTCSEIAAGTFEKPGLIINSSDGMLVYADGSVDTPIDVYHKDSGGSWNLGSDMGANSHGYSSCVTGADDGPHCVTISNSVARYVNKTNWGRGLEIDGTSDYDCADIEVDENGGVWITGAGTTDDTVKLVTSLTGWSSNIYTLKDLGSYINVNKAPSIAICGQNAYIAFSYDDNAYLFNFSIDDPSVWNETIVDTDPSYSVIVKCTSDGDVYLFYSDDYSIAVDSGHDIFYSNASSLLTNWTVRTERTEADPWGLQNVVGSNFPTFNRITNQIDYIAVASDYDLHYDNFSVSYTPPEPPPDSCTYSDGDWQIEIDDLCNLTDSSIEVDGTLIINGTTGRFLMDNSNLSSTGFSFQCNDCQMVIQNGAKFAQLI